MYLISTRERTNPRHFPFSSHRSPHTFTLIVWCDASGTTQPTKRPVASGTKEPSRGWPRPRTNHGDEAQERRTFPAVVPLRGEEADEGGAVAGTLRPTAAPEGRLGDEGTPALTHSGALKEVGDVGHESQHDVLRQPHQRVRFRVPLISHLVSPPRRDALRQSHQRERRGCMHEPVVTRVCMPSLLLYLHAHICMQA